MKTSPSPIQMEDHFSPGFITRPAVHIGSQTMRFYSNDEQEQAVENLHLAALGSEDIVILRNVSPIYIKYWETLFGAQNIVNLRTRNRLEYLSSLVLKNKRIINKVKSLSKPNSYMMVYFPTRLEEDLAEELGLSLHGASIISDKYGTKTGIRKLAVKEKIPMPEGYICMSYEEVEKALKKIFLVYDKAIIKHDLSSAGRWMKIINKNDDFNLRVALDEVCGGKYKGSKDPLVVEAWIESKASLCAHIEIEKNSKPVIVAAWQQIIDSDGKTYMGAGPLMISKSAFKSFIKELKKLASALKKVGAYGSFGPDFIITDHTPVSYPDKALLIELNARVPFTAFPLEIVKQVKGSVGSGFYINNTPIKKGTSYRKIFQVLDENKLLIKKKGSSEEGIVPFNPGLLKYGFFYFVSMAATFDLAKAYADKTVSVLSKI